MKQECPQFSSVQLSHSVMSDSLRPHEPQHARPPCPSPTPGVHPNRCALSRWCHPAISSSVVPFSSCPQSLPASGSFQMSQLFASGGQSIGVSASASVLPMNTQDWSPLGWTGWISLQSKGLSRVFSNTTVQKLWVVNAHYHHLNLPLYQKPLSQQTRKRNKWHLNWKGRSKNYHHLQITITITIYIYMRLPRWLSGNESAWMHEMRFDPWVRKMPWRRKW